MQSIARRTRQLPMRRPPSKEMKKQALTKEAIKPQGIEEAVNLPRWRAPRQRPVLDQETPTAGQSAQGKMQTRLELRMMRPSRLAMMTFQGGMSLERRMMRPSRLAMLTLQ